MHLHKLSGILGSGFSALELIYIIDMQLFKNTFLFLADYATLSGVRWGSIFIKVAVSSHIITIILDTKSRQTISLLMLSNSPLKLYWQVMHSLCLSKGLD